MTTNTTLSMNTKFEKFFLERNKITKKENKRVLNLKKSISKNISKFKISSFNFTDTPINFNQRYFDAHFDFNLIKKSNNLFFLKKVNLWYKEKLTENFELISFFEIEYIFNRRYVTTCIDFFPQSYRFDEEKLTFMEEYREIAFGFKFNNLEQFNNFKEKINVFEELLKNILA